MNDHRGFPYPPLVSRKANASDYLTVFGVIAGGLLVGFGLGLALGLHVGARPFIGISIDDAHKLSDASFTGGMNSAIEAHFDYILTNQGDPRPAIMPTEEWQKRARIGWEKLKPFAHE